MPAPKIWPPVAPGEKHFLRGFAIGDYVRVVRPNGRFQDIHGLPGFPRGTVCQVVDRAENGHVRVRDNARNLQTWYTPAELERVS